MYPDDSAEDSMAADSAMRGDAGDTGPSEIPTVDPEAEMGTAEGGAGHPALQTTDHGKGAEPRHADEGLGDRPPLSEEDVQPARPPRKKRSIKQTASPSGNQDVAENRQDSGLDKEKEEERKISGDSAQGELHFRRRQKESEEEKGEARTNQPQKNLDDGRSKKENKKKEQEGPKKDPCLSSDDACIRLKKELGLLDSVGLIMGNIIGSGIFMSPRGVLEYSGSVGMSLVIWAASGFVSMVGALCYAEMGTMIPQSGSHYTYLQEAFGPLPAFLYVWLVVTIQFPCSRAIVSLTFANYIVQPFFPGCAETPEAARKLIAIAVLLFLGWLNSRRVKWATTVQDVLALTKVLALIIIIITGIHYLNRSGGESFEDAFDGTNWHPALIATAFYHTLWAYDGWDSCNMIIEEMKDPYRNLPRAIAISLTSVTLIYMLTNVAYFGVLSPGEILASEAVAVTFGQRALGVMAWTIPIFVACSTGGGLNGSIFGASRLLFVSTRRGHLPKVLGLVCVENYTPVTSLLFLVLISLVPFITADIRVLVNYTAFAGNLVAVGTSAAFLWFRYKQPDRPRPIKVWIGFGILELAMAVFLVVLPAVREPVQMAAALGIALTGLLVYYVTQHRQRASPRLDGFMDKVTYVCQMLFVAVHEERSG
ncbi:Y+L amino acid transporter 2-like isoform X2 [Penaeus chinensis]|uniref:Y+L amino acid transporter 2-like isoform X2 n=1 Tax=Penaeus chinensis TaxID=139456 RepID=UPI001FB6955C|nr:Y+L amino acid transporter 2-like isoform X2 [Penaeus chinensis]